MMQLAASPRRLRQALLPCGLPLAQRKPQEVTKQL